jgi:hypothetical protein
MPTRRRDANWALTACILTGLGRPARRGIGPPIEQSRYKTPRVSASSLAGPVSVAPEALQGLQARTAGSMDTGGGRADRVCRTVAVRLQSDGGAGRATTGEIGGCFPRGGRMRVGGELRELQQEICQTQLRCVRRSALVAGGGALSQDGPVSPGCCDRSALPATAQLWERRHPAGLGMLLLPRPRRRRTACPRPRRRRTLSTLRPAGLAHRWLALSRR